MFSRPAPACLSASSPVFASPPRPQPAAPARPEALWADTLPACFRSEAFAEDLLDDGAAPPPLAQSAFSGIFR